MTAACWSFHAAAPGSTRRRCPSCAPKRGHDIVTSSGDTLLGADDKAGVAEIMSAVLYLAAHPELPRPTLRVGFTPDEEIGEGAALFDIERFGAACAYTAGRLGGRRDPERDLLRRRGGRDGARASTSIPAMATGKMVNALRLAAQIVAELPADGLTPETTSGRQGFIHPYELTGDPACAEIRAILRDFDDDLLREHVELFERTARGGRRPRAASLGGDRDPPSVPQHAPLHRRGSRDHHRGRGGDSGRGSRARPHRDSWRHRRLAAERDGAADAQPVHRRSRVSLRARVGLGQRHGRRRGHHSAPGRGVDAAWT